VRALTAVLRPLFFGPVVLAALGAFVAFDVWLFGMHGVAQGIRSTLANPTLILLLVGLLIASAAFHEFGHATACRYGGAEAGAMGVGLYLVWPAFYTDITDSYRLGKGGRLRTDLGGLYFNVLFILVTGAAYFATRFEPLLLVAVVLQLEMIMQFMPFLRMDGYYMVADLTGVPDLFSRIGPILASLVPRKRSDERVRQLKPWVRAAVTLWVLLVVPILLFQLSLVVIAAPRIFGTAWSSFGSQVDQVKLAWHGGQTPSIAVAVLKAALLALPALGIAYTFGRLGRRTARSAWRWSDGRPARRTSVLFLGFALAGGLAFLWWPRTGEYRPIQPHERWTVPDAAGAVSQMSGGRSGLLLGGTAAGSAHTGASPGPTPLPGASAGQNRSPGASTAPRSSPSPSTSGSPSTSPSPSPSDTPSTTASPSPSPSPTST